MEAIGAYWDHYHLEINRLLRQYPDRVRKFTVVSQRLSRALSRASSPPYGNRSHRLLNRLEPWPRTTSAQPAAAVERSARNLFALPALSSGFSGRHNWVRVQKMLKT